MTNPSILVVDLQLTSKARALSIPVGLVQRTHHRMLVHERNVVINFDDPPIPGLLGQELEQEQKPSWCHHQRTPTTSTAVATTALHNRYVRTRSVVVAAVVVAVHTQQSTATNQALALQEEQQKRPDLFHWIRQGQKVGMQTPVPPTQYCAHVQGGEESFVRNDK